MFCHLASRTHVLPSRTRLLVGGLSRIYVTGRVSGNGRSAVQRYDEVCWSMTKWSLECGVSAIIDLPFLVVFATAFACVPSGPMLVWNTCSFYSSPSGRSEVRNGWNRKLPARDSQRSTRRVRCQTDGSLASPLLSDDSFSEQVQSNCLSRSSLLPACFTEQHLCTYCFAGLKSADDHRGPERVWR